MKQPTSKRIFILLSSDQFLGETHYLEHVFKIFFDGLPAVNRPESFTKTPSSM
jgi:hypothetical protein